jgi:hypothetical protein
MKTVLPCAVMLLVVLSGTPGYPGTLTFYDDFNAGYIDPEKWFGVERGPATVEPGGVAVLKCPLPLPAGAGREAGTRAIRQVEDRRLRLFYLGYGGRDSNAGKLRRQLNLIMQDPPAAAVTAIQATVEVTALTTKECPNDPANYTSALATLGGRFFTATNSNGDVTDVVALIQLGRRSINPEPSNVLRAIARVLHCVDADCTCSEEPLLPLTPRDLDLVQLGQKVKLLVQWDQGNDQFIFQLDSVTEVVSYKPKLTVIGTPPTPNKTLSATLIVPNCTHPFRPEAFIDARFDDVDRSP